MRKVIFSIIILTSLPFLAYPENPNKKTQIHDTTFPVPELIKSKLDELAADRSIKIEGDKFYSVEYVTNLYSRNNFEPFWTDPVSTEDAIQALENSYKEGLIPQDYHLETIRKLYNELDSVNLLQPGEASKQADFDLLLTDGIIFYADHLLYGKINPVTLEPTWNYEFSPIPDLNPETLKNYISGHEIPARIDELRPEMPIYDSLVAILARYREIAAKGGWQTILTGGKIEPGDKDSRIPAIRKRLAMTGELTVKDTVSSRVYDHKLEADIKAFQASHGLDADGIIGAGTFRELSIPVEKRIESIRLNLERTRWVAGIMPDSYIIVNIAAFWLMVVKDNQVVHFTSVMVGRPLNKTPIFRDKLRYIEFNPTWTVPTSIIKNEIVPGMRRDTSYLKRNHMVLLDFKGKPVPDSTLDFKKISASHFPYIVRQLPGPWNALGSVKFMFPNKYDIYLHDTPSKNLFSKPSRAYSHGCIRVYKPEELAALLLHDTDYDLQKIKQIIMTRETTHVDLKVPLPVLLLYWTCGIDHNGKLYFVPDIYDRDETVLKELDKPLL